MYVDDSDIILTAISPNESPLDLHRRAQHAATSYQSAVAQTGGAVRPEKCRWYSIGFKAVNGKYTYVKNTMVPDIQIYTEYMPHIHQNHTEYIFVEPI